MENPSLTWKQGCNAVPEPISDRKALVGPDNLLFPWLKHIPTRIQGHLNQEVQLCIS